MLSRLVFICLCEPKIDDVHVVTSRLRPTYQEVIRFNIAVNDALIVDFFDAFDHLDADVQNGFQIETAFARLEQVLNRGAKQVHHHDVEVVVGYGAVSPDVVERRHASYIQIKST